MDRIGLTGLSFSLAKTSKGHIQQLPSGSFRVKVYAGTNPVTGKARLLRQTCPDEAAAYAALSRMLGTAAAGSPTAKPLSATRSTSTSKSPTWRCRPGRRTEGYVRRTIESGARRGQDPQAGRGLARRAVRRAEEVLPAVRAAAADRAPRRRSATQCDQRCGPLQGPPDDPAPRCATPRCGPHVCKPMKPATIPRIRSIISSALDLAVRYDWAGRNVAQ